MDLLDPIYLSYPVFCDKVKVGDPINWDTDDELRMTEKYIQVRTKCPITMSKIYADYDVYSRDPLKEKSLKMAFGSLILTDHNNVVLDVGHSTGNTIMTSYKGTRVRASHIKLDISTQDTRMPQYYGCYLSDLTSEKWDKSLYNCYLFTWHVRPTYPIDHDPEVKLMSVATCSANKIHTHRSKALKKISDGKAKPYKRPTPLM